ncbi:MAG TPA: aminopeptidase, partial [Xanthomonadales bacterium]|nr:aminopeptidase [Xanthomonadales bacterium]
QRRKAEPQFTNLLAETRESLRQLYASGQEVTLLREQKQASLAETKTRYQQLVRDEWQGRDYFGSWMEGELNNARLAMAESYAGGSCAFAALYQQAGGELAGFYALAEQQAELSQAERDAWLQAPCEKDQ